MPIRSPGYAVRRYRVHRLYRNDVRSLRWTCLFSPQKIKIVLSSVRSRCSRLRLERLIFCDRLARFSSASSVPQEWKRHWLSDTRELDVSTNGGAGIDLPRSLRSWGCLAFEVTGTSAAILTLDLDILVSISPAFLLSLFTHPFSLINA